MDTGAWLAFGGLLFTVVAAIIGAAIRFQKAADDAEKNRIAIDLHAQFTKEAIDDIHRRKAIMSQKIEAVGAALADFRAYVSANFAPMASLEKMETRIMNALDAIGKRLDRRE